MVLGLYYVLTFILYWYIWNRVTTKHIMADGRVDWYAIPFKVYVIQFVLLFTNPINIVSTLIWLIYKYHKVNMMN